jgi:hypothetical protein
MMPSSLTPMKLYEIREEIESIISQADDDGCLPDDAYERLSALGMAESEKMETSDYS